MRNYIILHLYYLDLWDEFWIALQNIVNENNRLIITLPEEHADQVDFYQSHSEYITCKLYPNYGADIRPFLCVINDLIKSGESINAITKIHTKKSLHSHPETGFGEFWRKSLYQPLLEHNEYLTGLIERQSEVGMIAVKNFHTFEPNYHPNYNVERTGIEEALRLFNFQKPLSYEYVTGTMFIASFDYLKSLITNCDFETVLNNSQQPHSQNGTLVHGIERLFGYGLAEYNKTIILI